MKSYSDSVKTHRLFYFVVFKSAILYRKEKDA